MPKMSIERKHQLEKLQQYEGGATRSQKLERYDLIPVETLTALAFRFGLGAVKHGENNWKGGDKNFIKSCLNHLQCHYVSLVHHGTSTDDDDIGAMLWNVGVLAWFRAYKPLEFDLALLEMRAERKAKEIA